MGMGIDIRDVLPAVNVPTLILHRTDDQVCHVENARYMASHIRDAKYVELPGNDHAPWVNGGNDILAEIQEFLTGVREPVQPDRVLATVMFTDIVGSTALATERGDRRWAELLERHHAIVRGELGAVPRARGRHRRRRLLRDVRRTGSSHPLRASDLELRTRAGHPGPIGYPLRRMRAARRQGRGHRRPHRRSRGVVRGSGRGPGLRYREGPGRGVRCLVPRPWPARAQRDPRRVAALRSGG